jgi:putative MATE family efflux protein
MRVRIDMTTGSPLKRMLAFSWPMMLGSALAQCSNLVDSLIIGRAAGMGAFAAVAAAAPVAFLATGFLMGFCNGFLIPIALEVGAGDRDAADRFASAALLMAAGMALVVAVPAALMAERLIELAGTPSDIALDAVKFLRVELIGIPVPLITMTLAGILRAGGDTRTPLYYLALGMALHLILDLVLIAGLKMGVVGAALASLIAHSIAMALCMRRVFRERPGVLRLIRFGVRPGVAKRLLKLGVPIGLTSLMASVGATAFQYSVNSLGSSAVVAVAAADRLFSLAVMPAMALGGAVEVFSGQNCGAGRTDRIHTGVKQLCLLMAGVVTPLTVALSLISHRAVPLLVEGVTPELIALSGRFMLLCALFVPLQCASVVLKNVLQGVGRPERALTASAYDLLVRLALAVVGVRMLGFDAICAVNPVCWALSALALVVAYRAALGLGAVTWPSEEKEAPACRRQAG